MRTKWILATLALGLAAVALAQTLPPGEVIPLSQEPHHHLLLHNDYVNVYRLEVSPGDSVKLHRHDYDAISVMLGPANVTVHSPDKPDARLKLTAAQVRMQAKGYVHSTEIDADSDPYRNVTVKLLKPQHNERNRCAAVIAGQPLNCGLIGTVTTETETTTAQLESDETYVSLYDIHPNQSVKVGGGANSWLVVAVDEATANAPNGTSNGGKDDALHSGDFVWVNAQSSRTFRSAANAELRLVVFSLKP